MSHPLLSLIAGQAFLVEQKAGDQWLESLLALPADPKMWGSFADHEPARYRVDHGVAYVPVTGMITRTEGWLTFLCGGSSYEGIASAAAAADADPAVNRIVFEIDSYGGSSAGVWSCCEAIGACHKPTLARVVGNAFSAALFIGLAADEIEAHSTTVVGSIGAIFQVAQQGESRLVTFVSAASPNKAASPTDPAGQAMFQGVVDGLGDAFVEWVAARRGVSPAEVPARFGGGGIMPARAAFEAGLIDRLIAPRLADKAGDSPQESPVDELDELRAENERLKKEKADLEDELAEAREGDGEGEGEGEGDGEGDGEMVTHQVDAQLAEARLRYERSAAGLRADIIYRDGLTQSRVAPARKKACVGRLSVALSGEDAPPDTWDGAIEYCRRLTEDGGDSERVEAAREWLSGFGEAKAGDGVDLRTHTRTATSSHAGLTVTDVKAALMGDGLTADMAQQLGVDETNRGGGLSDARANTWVSTYAPSLFNTLLKR